MRKSWQLSIKDKSIELDDFNQEYLAKVVKDGFEAGEIIQEDKRSWWTITINDPERCDLFVEDISNKIKEGFTSGIV